MNQNTDQNTNQNIIDYLTQLNLNLGIDLKQQLAHGLELFELASDCVSCGVDYYQRPVFLLSSTFNAWMKMHDAAKKDGIDIFICSAFRDYDYQANLIQKKLSQGQDIKAILKILAAPGFSEHHTGRAIDIISPEISELSQEFEHTNAFQWLDENARFFNFIMTYPRGNRYGIMYEPWHWCFH